MVFIKKYLKKLYNLICNILKFVWAVVSWPYHKIKDEIEFRRKIKKLREQDSFIYK